MLWEMLMLEGFQAGLAWIIVLRKREAFRKAFAGFDPKKVARFGKAGSASGDATNVEDVKRVTAEAQEFLGGIDTLVVSAGAGGRSSRALWPA